MPAYQLTGHGRAFHLPSPDSVVEDFSKATVYDKHSNLWYRAFWRGRSMWVAEYRLEGKDTVHLRQEQVDFVIGSGNQTRSYLREEKGYFFEMPITWYVGKRIWDLSPGYENGNNSRFERPIGDMCMHCHNTGSAFTPHSINRFTSVGNGIGCEKCHGPGELHIQAMQSGKQVDTKTHTDYSIVNPKRLPIQLQFDVCRQCHLEGVTVPKEGRSFFDYRPGMALAGFYDVFIPVSGNPEQFGFASHAERLQQAPCFIKSDGKLTCTTCHDPHRPLPKDEVLFYNQKCQSCHQPSECDENHQKRMARNDNCASCHMPKSGTTDIPHVSSTDHFIRKRPGAVATVTEQPAGSLVQFKSFTSEVKPEERAALLANMLYYEQNDPNTAYLERISQFVSRLDLDNRIRHAYLSGSRPDEEMLALEPGQISSPYTASYLAELRKNARLPALPWAQRAVALAPYNVDFLYLQANILASSGQEGQALDTYRQIIKLQPQHKKALVSLGYLHLTEGQAGRALELFNRAISLDPDYVLAYENKASLYLQQEKYAEAAKVLDVLIARQPQNERYKTLRTQVQQQL